MITQSTIRSQAINQFVQFKREVSAKQAASSQTTFNMPSDKQLDVHMESLHNVLFNANMTPQVENAMLMLAKGFTFMIPYYDVYRRYVLENNPTQKEIVEAYEVQNWTRLPQGIKNKIMRSADRLLKKHKDHMDKMTWLMESQAENLNMLNDDEAETIMDFEPSELEKKHTEINSYITYAPQEDAYLMTPKQIAAYLAVQSKGMIYLTPAEVSQELKARKYKQSEHRTAFFVKTI